MYFVSDVTIHVYFILLFMLSLQVRILSAEEGSNSGLVTAFVRTEEAELCSDRKYSEDGSYFTRRRLFDITNTQRH
jgi:hypothetical protein